MIRHCIIGAGFSGLTVARKLKELGEPFDVIDANSGIGGLWHTGAYDSAHLISSKRDTQFGDFPMPAGYPDFPGKLDMQRYLRSYSDACGITEHVQLNSLVQRVGPVEDFDLTRQWEVQVEGETPRRYSTVVIANGHLSAMSSPKKPQYPGEFLGEIRYANSYRNADDFKDKRVLVVGAGNTGCDIAVETSRVASQTSISMRKGKHFLPKTFLGVPLSDLPGQTVSVPGMDRLAAGLIGRLSFGNLAQYGLPKPSHRILDEHPTVNSQLLYQLKHGTIKVCPEIKAYHGQEVEFVDGTRAEFDLIIFATGYEVRFPMLQKGLLEWEDGLPILFLGMMAPRYRGLFFAGLGQAQAGGGPLFQGGGDILGRLLAGEVRSEEGVMDLIRQTRSIRLAEFMGMNLVEKLDMTSQRGWVVRAAIRQALKLLDAIGCPDAPRTRLCQESA